MKLLWGIAVTAAMGGCGLFPAAPEPAVPDPVSAPTPGADYMKENAEVSALLAYYQDLLAMPPEELKREFQGINQSFARDRSELGRLRLALLMCVPGAAWRDDARLLALLDGAASRKTPSDSPRHQFIVLLQKLVIERQREQKRADELQQKLDTMLTIERNLRGRQSPKK
ncbi:MAG: hypothetical protein HZC23_12480 [Rhodocyclales bacterium]|nr:hypothetical protein [Rhodocyclales bacterium]